MAYGQQQTAKKLKLATTVTGQLIDKCSVMDRGQERFEFKVYNKEFKETFTVRVPESEFEKFKEGDILEISADIYVSNDNLKFYCKEPKKSASSFPRAVNSN